MRHPDKRPDAGARPPRGLYSPAERARRDASPWTLVQGVLAPLQFLVFLVSLGLLARTLWTGEGQDLAELSVQVKTAVLLLIMVTGSIWEKDVFGRWLLAPAFFWEDMVSFLVIALHLLCVLAMVVDLGLGPRDRLLLALAAYASYVVNAGQFLWKLRMARLEAPPPARPAAAGGRLEGWAP